MWGQSSGGITYAAGEHRFLPWRVNYRQQVEKRRPILSLLKGYKPLATHAERLIPEAKERGISSM